MPQTHTDGNLEAWARVRELLKKDRKKARTKIQEVI